MTTPFSLLRSTGPHVGLAALSAELWAAYERLPKAQRLALIARDDEPRAGDSELESRVALALSTARVLSEARQLAREAVVETRGILSPDGKVTR